MKTKAMIRFIVVLLCISLAAMAAGWFIPSVPLLSLALGFWGVILGAALLLARRIGIFLTIVAVFVILTLLPTGIIPIAIPIIGKDFPRRADENVEVSDVLKSKHPTYVPDMIEKRRIGGCDYFVNRSGSVIALDLGETVGAEAKLSTRLYPTFGKAIRATGSFGCDMLPSVDLVDEYKKHLDDAIMKAVELHCSSGSGLFPGGKQGFLCALLQAVEARNDSSREDAAAYLAAAVELGGGNPTIRPVVREKAARLIRKFLSDAAKSSPTGFYSESKALECIFRRDRFLAEPVMPGESLASLIPIAAALDSHPDLLRAYTAFLTLDRHMNNADVDLSIRDLIRHRDLLGDEFALSSALDDDPAMTTAAANKGGQPGVAFWPACTSPESRLFARMYSSEELPAGNCMEDLVRALRTGEISLDPTPDSGYYDYQLHALETLVMPDKAQEANKLLLRAKYKKRLREAFEAMLTKRRETHVKYLDRPGTAGDHVEPMPCTPELSVEPCATNYLRTARAYRFLADALKAQLSEKELRSIHLPGSRSGLLDHLNDATDVFYGLYLVVCNDIGMCPRLQEGELENHRVSVPNIGKTNRRGCIIAALPGVSANEQAARLALWARAKDWLKRCGEQDLANEDVRVIVPVLSNMRGTQVRYWSVIGTKLLKIKAYYAIPPRLTEKHFEETDKSGRFELDQLPEGWREWRVEWRAKDYVIPVQVFAEVTLGPKPLTRQEFRAICDRCSTKGEIIETLKTASSPGIHDWGLWALLGAIICGGGMWTVGQRRKKHVGLGQ